MKGDTIMRKFIICALVALTTVSAFGAQKEKTLADSVRVRNNNESFVVNVGGGLNTLIYDINSGKNKLGGGVLLQGQYQHMFNEHWGIGVGAGFSWLNATSVLDQDIRVEGVLAPTETGVMRIPVNTFMKDWRETQNAISINIPVQALYRWRFNDKWQGITGLGLTANFPAWIGYKTKGTNQTTDNFATSMGYQEDMTGTTHQQAITEAYKGKVAHRAANLGMQFDAGALYQITELMDFYFGLYLDAQFLSTVKRSDAELSDPNEGIYANVLNSNQLTKYVHPLEFGVKLGLRICTRDKEAEAQKIDSILNERLNAYRSAAISEIGKVAGIEDGTASDEMRAIYDKYAESIKNASSKEEIDALKAQALEEIDLQKYKEAAIVEINNDLQDNDSDETRAIAAAYAAAIQNATSKEEVDRLKAECMRAMQTQREKEEAERQERLRRERAEEEARLRAAWNANEPVFNKVAAAEIDTLIMYLNDHPDDILCITGHNDATGNPDKDMFLGMERAEAYKAALVARGVPEDRIACFSKGSEEPIADNRTAAGRKANRRVTFGIRSKAEVEAERALAAAHKVAWDAEQARLARQSGLDKVIDTRNVTFEVNSDVPVFNEIAIEGVKTVAEFMKEYSNKKLVLTGHTDNTGEADYNVILGKRRAQGYKTKMVEYGVEADRVECLSKGPYQPIESNATKEGRAANRRVEMAFEDIQTADPDAVAIDVPQATESEYPMLTVARQNALHAMAAVIVRPDDKQVEIFNKYVPKVNKAAGTDAIAAVEKEYAQEMEAYLRTL